jgi:hypothetical protein
MFILLFSHTQLTAEFFYLKNGQKLMGEIIKNDYLLDQITVKTPTETVVLKKMDVLRIATSKDEPEDLYLKIGVGTSYNFFGNSLKQANTEDSLPFHLSVEMIFPLSYQMLFGVEGNLDAKYFFRQIGSGLYMDIGFGLGNITIGKGNFGQEDRFSSNLGFVFKAGAGYAFQTELNPYEGSLLLEICAIYIQTTYKGNPWDSFFLSGSFGILW